MTVLYNPIYYSLCVMMPVRMTLQSVYVLWIPQMVWYLIGCVSIGKYDISRRIVEEVNHVVYDITSKPPATIEWE